MEYNVGWNYKKTCKDFVFYTRDKVLLYKNFYDPVVVVAQLSSQTKTNNYVPKRFMYCTPYIY